MPMTLNKNFELNRGNMFSLAGSVKTRAWPNKTTIDSANGLTPYLRVNNPGTATGKLVSGSVTSSSDYITFKKLNAMRRK